MNWAKQEFYFWAKRRLWAITPEDRLFIWSRLSQPLPDLILPGELRNSNSDDFGPNWKPVE